MSENLESHLSCLDIDNQYDVTFDEPAAKRLRTEDAAEQDGYK